MNDSSIQTTFVPKSDIEVLSQLISDEIGTYRIRAGQRVHYLHIPVDVFDDPTMCRPYLLIPALPDIPDTDFTNMHITRAPDGSLHETIHSNPLPVIITEWHPNRIDVLTVEKRAKYFHPNVSEVSYVDGGEEKIAVAKFAHFEWNTLGLEKETYAYDVI